MTKSDQSRLRILILLLAALGLTVFLSSRMTRRANPAVVQAENQKVVAVALAQPDARIRLDLLNKETLDKQTGKKNLFEYAPPPAPPAPRPSPFPPAQPPPNAMTSRPPMPSGPPQPPPPPPIPLRYIGFAFVEPNSKSLIATLIDDSQRHFLFVEGDVYQGRYRIARITDTSVEVEDLQFPRRQVLPLVKQ